MGQRCPSPVSPMGIADLVGQRCPSPVSPMGIADLVGQRCPSPVLAAIPQVCATAIRASTEGSVRVVAAMPQEELESEAGVLMAATSCFKGPRTQRLGLRVSFGDSSLSTFPCDGALHKFIPKKRVKGQPVLQGPGYVSSIEALSRAQRLSHEVGHAAAQNESKHAAAASWSPARLIFDTGSGDHLMGVGNVPKQLARNSTLVDVPQTLMTANGPVTVDRQVHFPCPALGVDVDALLLKDSPNVLSAGRLVDEEELDF